METPEKIYLHPDIGGKEFIKPWLKRPFNENSIEYTLTDAFIERACDWLHLQLNKINMKGEDMGNFLNDFKNYMKGK